MLTDRKQAEAKPGARSSGGPNRVGVGWMEPAGFRSDPELVELLAEFRVDKCEWCEAQAALIRSVSSDPTC